VVKKGETLSEIAQHHLGKGASVHDIYNYVNKLGKTNHIHDVNKIHVGEVIHFSDAAKPGSHHDRPASSGHSDKPTVPAKPDAPPAHAKPDAPPATAKPDAPPATAKPDAPPATAKPDASPAAKPEESGFMGFIHKTEAVVGDIASGCVDEVIHHPGRVLENVAIGAVAAVGATLLAPELLVAAAVVGIGAGVYEVAKHGGEWVNAADVVANPNGHTAQEQKAAHDTLHGVGGGITDLAAGLAGGGLGSLGVKVAGELVGGEVAAEVTAGRAGATEAAAGRTATTGDAAAGKAATTGEASELRAPAKGAVETDSKVPPAEAQPVEGVKIASSEDGLIRRYQVDGKDYDLHQHPPQAWFYGKAPQAEVAPVKLHVMVSGPEDLARVQKVLIPFLNDNPEASQLAEAWKTFDPKLGFSDGEAGGFGPGPTGQNAKGFTVYARTNADALKLQAQIDKELASKGLGLEKPPATGNVDLIEGSSNRVGTVRDYYDVAQDAQGNVGAKIDDELAQRIQSEFGGGGKMDSEQLRAVEKETGLENGSLTYDKKGKLMLKLEQGDRPRGGKVYVSESGSEDTFGYMTDRPAIYALARRFGWNPANGVT
jgi:hypothetical protein